MMEEESMMSGFCHGRYMDRNLLVAQVDHRFLHIPYNITDPILDNVEGMCNRLN